MAGEQIQLRLIFNKGQRLLPCIKGSRTIQAVGNGGREQGVSRVNSGRARALLFVGSCCLYPEREGNEFDVIAVYILRRGGTRVLLFYENTGHVTRKGEPRRRQLPCRLGYAILSVKELRESM
ncbi:hypothetical protein KIL84_009646 [Mauremys mutica]|uniref:Uncharacterized protein n=1 Tax=Mauremys mutica TaxID=74926 RepID=A0A9D3XLL4_9SAUR|nr:hypothetical protein KIL84_009646 [Mauremys mutica]